MEVEQCAHAVEQKLLGIEGVEQAVLIGHGRPYLTAVMTGTIDTDALKVAVDAVNETLTKMLKAKVDASAGIIASTRLTGSF